MRYITILWVLIVICYGGNVKDVEYYKNKFSKEYNSIQKLNIIKELVYGLHYAEEDNNGVYIYILAGIISKESSAGIKTVNKNDGVGGSYSRYQIQLGPHMRAKNIEMTDKNKKKVIKRLLEDERYAAEAAMLNLRYWNKVHKGDIRKMLSSYNCGFKGPKKEACIRYANDVIARASAIQAIVIESKLIFILRDLQRSNSLDNIKYNKNYVLSML